MQLTAHLSCPDQNSGSTSVLFRICAIAQALRSCTSRQALHLKNVKSVHSFTLCMFAGFANLLSATVITSVSRGTRRQAVLAAPA